MHPPEFQPPAPSVSGCVSSASRTAGRRTAPCTEHSAAELSLPGSMNHPRTRLRGPGGWGLSSGCGMRHPLRFKVPATVSGSPGKASTGSRRGFRQPDRSTSRSAPVESVPGGSSGSSCPRQAESTSCLESQAAKARAVAKQRRASLSSRAASRVSFARRDFRYGLRAASCWSSGFSDSATNLLARSCARFDRRSGARAIWRTPAAPGGSPRVGLKLRLEESYRTVWIEWLHPPGCVQGNARIEGMGGGFFP